MTEAPVWRKVDVVAFGRKLRGQYFPDGQTVRVKAALGESSSKYWGRNPESVAISLLIEMAREGKA